MRQHSYNTNKYVLDGRINDAFSVDQGYPQAMAGHVLEILERERVSVQYQLDDARKALEVAEEKAAAFRLIVDGVTGQRASHQMDTALLASLARNKGAIDPIGVVQAASHTAMCPDGKIHTRHNYSRVGHPEMVHCPGVNEADCGLDTYHHEHFWGCPFDTQHRCPGHIRPTE